MNVIITGASKGLGKAIALQYAAAGYTLILCSRGAKALYDLVEEIQFYYPETVVKAMPVDVSIKEDVLEFTKFCLQFGTPDILINNAGVLVNRAFPQLTSEDFDTIFTTN